ncbi:aminotransferase class I/II-fold pyridoxal phosphate-dependent enzyme [Candidatus Actinomarina]|nr:aminotransferase class I/II-fold pyridoxal phosphate-dependent enzyme [Candidatus Actinomarina sp.]
MKNMVTAETVSPGHPDKIADLISDYVLTQALKNNSASKVAVETFLTGTKNGGLVLVGGEISEIANITSEDIKEIVNLALSKTIKTSFEDFDLEKLSIYNELTPQSEEIRAAVEDDINQGAGDQGIMVGYATNKTKSLMPVTFDKSRNIQKSLWNLQNSDPMLDLDSKVQVTSGGEKTKVVFSTQHQSDIDLEKLKEFGNIYSRLGNPTVGALEARLTALEDGAMCVALSSGTSAVMYSLINIMSQGDNFVAANQLYGGTYTMFDNILPEYGIDAKKVDITDLKAVEDSIDDKTRAIYCETVTNPGLIVADVTALSEIAHKHGIPLIVDATFTTSAIQKSFDFGADIVVYSLTKWMSGHGRVIAGAVIEKGGFDWGNGNFPLYDKPDSSYGNMRWGHDLGDLGNVAYSLRLRTVPLRNLGANMSPDTAFEVMSGLETLSLRMERHCSNAKKAAEFLSAHDSVEWVRFPGLEGDPSYELSEKYLNGTGGTMVVFGIKGGKDSGQKFIDNLKMFRHVANVGDTRSLAIHPASTTHSQLDDEALVAAGSPPELVRLSIGIENIEDIIEDLSQAIESTK